jgi:hypothetical protein
MILVMIAIYIRLTDYLEKIVLAADNSPREEANDTNSLFLYEYGISKCYECSSSESPSARGDGLFSRLHTKYLHIRTTYRTTTAIWRNYRPKQLVLTEHRPMVNAKIPEDSN